jgi:transcriptional regulator with XRE-family HTH domain
MYPVSEGRIRAPGHAVSPDAGHGTATDRLLGRRLKEERLLSGQSQAALAQRLGIEPEVLQAHEAGDRRIGPREIVAASVALGVPLSVLFYEGPERAPTAAPDDERCPRIAISRPLSLLSRPDFAPVRSLVELWIESRGRLPADLSDFMVKTRLLPRMILAREMPGSRRLVVHHLGSAIEMFLPCETLLLAGRDLDDLYDREYGAWVAESYARSLAAARPNLQGVRARIDTAADRAIEGRYDRLLLPWAGAGGERFVMGISQTRTHRVLTPRTAAERWRGAEAAGSQGAGQ